MNVATAKDRLKECERELDSSPLTLFHVFERDGRPLRLSITPRLKKRAIKDGVWRSKEMLITLTNAEYGYDQSESRSISGRDGIFLLDRSFRPENEMMRKLFRKFIDKENSGFVGIAKAIEHVPSDLLPVRLVSHHLRLLGLLVHDSHEDHLVLVDCDRSK